MRAQQLEQLLATLGADQHPLPALVGRERRPEVADRKVGQAILVVEAAQAGGREDPALAAELRDVQIDEVDLLHVAILVAQMHAEILHKLVVDNRLRRLRGHAEEAHQVGVGGVVGAGDTDHVELIDAQLCLQDAQGVNLAARADESDPLEAGGAHFVDDLQAWREARLVAGGGAHLGGRAGQEGQRRPARAGGGLGDDHPVYDALL